MIDGLHLKEVDSICSQHMGTRAVCQVECICPQDLAFALKVFILMSFYYTYTHTGETRSDQLRGTHKMSSFYVSDVLLIRTCLLHVHYYSKPNNAQKLVYVKQKFVLKVFVLTRFYCMWIIL